MSSWFEEEEPKADGPRDQVFGGLIVNREIVCKEEGMVTAEVGSTNWRGTRPHTWNRRTFRT